MEQSLEELLAGTVTSYVDKMKSYSLRLGNRTFRYKTDRDTRLRIEHDPCRKCGGWVLTMDKNNGPFSKITPHCTRCGSKQLPSGSFIDSNIRYGHVWLSTYMVCG